MPFFHGLFLFDRPARSTSVSDARHTWCTGTVRPAAPEAAQLSTSGGGRERQHNTRRAAYPDVPSEKECSPGDPIPAAAPDWQGSAGSHSAPAAHWEREHPSAVMG
jgi:hypothetical protein